MGRNDNVGLGEDGLMGCSMDQGLCNNFLRVWWNGSTKLGRWDVRIHGLKQMWFILFLRNIEGMIGIIKSDW